MYWEFHEQNGKQAVRLGKWKGVKINVSQNKLTALELYDLEKDPHETTNIAIQYPSIVEKLEAIIKNAHTETADWPLLKLSNSK